MRNAAAAGLSIVYDQRYPPGMTDLTPAVRAIKAADPRYRICRSISSGYRGFCAGGQRSQAEPENDRRRDARAHGYATEDADGPADERLCEQCRRFRSDAQL